MINAVLKMKSKTHKCEIYEMRDGTWEVYCGEDIEKCTPRRFKDADSAKACYERVFAEKFDVSNFDCEILD